MERKRVVMNTIPWVLAASLTVLSVADNVAAQDASTPSRARTATEALNRAPADSTLGARPPTPTAPPVAARPRARTLTDVLNQTADLPPPATVSARPQAPPPAAPPIATQDVDTLLADLPVGPVSAMAPLPLGYYVRGDLDCNRIWQGEGNLAWLSETAFTIDFGGCDPGTIQQVGDTLWHEDQRCMTELGGDGGVFSIDYELDSADTLVTRTRLGADTTEQRDRWTHCPAADVPSEARFHPDDATRPG